MTRTLLVGILACLALPASGQVVLDGRVLAQEDGSALPAATIQIEGTYSGTITNADGRFSVELTSLPVVLVVRYLGYATERVTIDERSASPVVIRLRPEPVTLAEIVVSAEDPAVEIMRQVIRRKRAMRDSLRTFEAKAYNRFTLENDTGIVSIVESLSQFVWDRERGGREVVQAQRSTANMEIEGVVPAGLAVTNLYDDNINVSGHNLYGVTHPDAIRHYDFRLESTTRQEGRDVFTISVRTRSKLTSGFNGTVVVVDSVFALSAVELRPNDSFVFPPPIQFFDVAYRQQYLPFDQGQWLPVDYRADLDLKVGFRGVLSFPAFRIRQFSRLTDYLVNVPLADSLYASKRRVYRDSLALKSAALLDQEGSVVPLDAREKLAYTEIDSSLTMEKAFEPEGPMARLAKLSMRFDDGDGNGGGGGGSRDWVSFAPSFWYNRVEGASPAAALTLGRRATATARVGYAFGLETWHHGYAVGLQAARSVSVSASWDQRVRPTYTAWHRSALRNSLAFVLGRPDYFDYYRSQMASASVTYTSRGWGRVRIGVQREQAEAAPTTTTFQLRDLDPVMGNPGVPAGTTGSVVASFEVGNAPDPFGIVSGNSLGLDIEHAPDGFLGSDHAFSRARMRGTLHIPTFFRRRLLPQSLDIHAQWGVSSGLLPAQRMWAIDGSNRGSMPGTLRTLEGRPYQGDRVALVTWEHHFRSLPFERMGWDWPVQRGWGILLFGGHGRSWLRDQNRTGEHVPRDWTPSVATGWHHEIGASLSGVLGLLRVDVARRLDREDWAVGIGAARLF